MLIDKLKPTSVKVNSSSPNYSSLSATSSNLSDSLSSDKNSSSKLVLAQVDSGNIDSMTHSIVENVLEHFDTKLPFLLNEVNSPSDSLKDHLNNKSVNVVIVGINDEDLNSVYSNTKNKYNIKTSDSSPVILGGINSISNAITKSTTTTKSTSTTTTTTTTTTTQTTTKTTTTSTTTTTTAQTTTITEDSNRWDYKRDCGVRPLRGSGRIVGGTKTKFGDCPWQ